jgi:TRAP-type C4-dicarboxylate transport system substrate-binding protein
MRIDIESRWRQHQVDFETGLIGDVQAGKADLGAAGAEAWASAGVTSFQALDAPLLIDSYTLQARVLRSPLIGQMLGGLAAAGLAGIGVLPGTLRKPLGITRPLRSPSDYAGLTIGTQQSRVADATMRALGARPVWFGSEAPVAGLGGIEQQISQIQDTGYDQAGKYLTANVSLWPRPLVLFASRQTWAALTPAQRAILRQAVTADLTAETQVVRDNEQTDTAILCRRGVRFLTATPADVAALRRAVRPVYHQLERDPQTPCARRFLLSRHRAARKCRGWSARRARSTASGSSPAPPPTCGRSGPRKVTSCRRTTGRTRSSSTAGGSRTRKRPGGRAPGATEPSPSTETTSSSCSPTAAASPPTMPPTNLASCSPSGGACIAAC